MKKSLLFIILLIFVVSFVGCDNDIPNSTSIYTDSNNDNTIFEDSNDNDSKNTIEYIIDYNDSTSFEKALNNGIKVKNKIV